METVFYKGYYIDQKNKYSILIKNDGNFLSFTINDIVFCGSEFSDFCIQNDLYEFQKDNFTFSETHYLTTDTIEHTLCNCVFLLSVPQTIIIKETNFQLKSSLDIRYTLGNTKSNGGLDKEWIELSIYINGYLYVGAGDYFEIALDKIKAQFNNNYTFRNCYGCLLSDYSIYGQSAFGSLKCFLKQKDAYLNAKDKMEYDSIEEYDNVQETYCCNSFEIRSSGTGYRG